ncbi:MAG: ABC transporter ATP-binding protein [Lachnospiraceae bacterium]|nr:ABC transporter ATP-binding protein [Lachnospiraceae bacterium]
MTYHILKAECIKAGYNHKNVLSDVTVDIPHGKISVILGANGCGKSTLLKVLSRLLPPQSGKIILDNKNISDISSRQIAKTIDLLPQSPFVPEGIRVIDLISRGRFPYRQFLKSMNKDDFQAVEEAMELMGITELADRVVEELSGGQRQRVWIALALAQQTDILLLDEPTTFLDIAYQIEILDILAELNSKYKTTIVMVLHDINLSARYADYLFAMKNGKLVAEGTPDEIIVPELIQEVYGLACDVIIDPVSKSPMILPKGRKYNVLRQ